MRGAIPVAVTLSLLAVSALAPVAAELPDTGIPVTPNVDQAFVDTHTWPIVDADGNQIDSRTWRVIEGTGNCCENYISTTQTGRLMDLGGSDLKFSDDRGQTWEQVFTVGALSGEGAVTTTADGDVIGMTWDVLKDDVVTVKYDAQDDQWYAAQASAHTPFFDRPWLGSMKGGPTAEHHHVGLLRGGLIKTPMFASLDGGHRYSATVEPSQWVGTAAVAPQSIDVPEDPMMDWSQPLTTAHASPFPGGGAIVGGPGFPDGCAFVHLKEDLTGQCLDLGPEHGRMLVDGAGNLHVVQAHTTRVDYKISRDGGQSWQTTTVEYEPDMSTEDWDFKANAANGIGVVAVHAHDGQAGTDQDIVLKFDTSDGAPTLTTRYRVGDGDLNAGAGFGCGCARFDFTSVALFPDGKIAVSFTDQAHHPPSIAVET